MCPRHGAFKHETFAAESEDMATVPCEQTVARGAVGLHLQYSYDPERKLTATSYETRPRVGWLR